jgi:hypothetical protein
VRLIPTSAAIAELVERLMNFPNCVLRRVGHEFPKSRDVG